MKFLSVVPALCRATSAKPSHLERVYRDGWLPTGDIGFVDSEGFLTILGRTKEVINRGGEKVSPAEIEEALMLHQCVREAALWSSASSPWRECCRGCCTAAGNIGYSAGAAKISAGPSRAFQNSATHRHRQLTAEKSHRQDPQKRARGSRAASRASHCSCRSSAGISDYGYLETPSPAVRYWHSR